MQCPKCEQGVLVRVKREGLFAAVASRLGYFPWKCATCNAQVRLKSRGKKVRRRTYIEPESDPPL